MKNKYELYFYFLSKNETLKKSNYVVYCNTYRQALKMLKEDLLDWECSFVSIISCKKNGEVVI